MGLLEDAIREHLELKRRHGADANEVAQAERDALGPAGRPTPLEDTAAAHAAEMTPSAREAPEPMAEPFDLVDDEFDEPAGVLDEERIEAGAPTQAYEIEHFEEEEEEPELVAAEETPPLEAPPVERPAPESESPYAAADPGLLEAEPAPAPPETEVAPAPPETEVTPAPPETEVAPAPPETEVTPAPPETEVTPAQPEAELPPSPPEAASDFPTRIAPALDLDARPPPLEPPPGTLAASTFEDAPPAEPPEEDEAPPGAVAASTLEDAPPAEPPEADQPPPAGDEGEEAGEDVLEETPEFLQETPEHDRLWFEQKPPRDFDFGS